MCKKYGFITLCVMFLIISISSISYGVPTTNFYISVTPYWQTESVWSDKTYDHGDKVILDCGIKKDGTYEPTIGRCGCALTSLVMILKYYGLGYIPDDYHDPTIVKTDPLNLNDWMRQNNGYDSSGSVKWLSMDEFYYYNWPTWYWYTYLRPDNSCFTTSSKNNCFSVGWSTQSETLLDYDLLSGRPDIARIKKADGRKHFVVISGYDTVYSSYRANDPGKDYPWPPPPALEKLYPGSKLLQIYRYEGVITTIPPSVGYLYFYNLSPVEYQIINSEGLITGFDPNTGGKIQDIPYANYFEESIDSLDPDTPPSEPHKVLMIDTPASGNYIIRVIGVGEGPFSIMMSGKSDNGANIADAPIITGTAYPGMVESYRLQYSSTTGEAIISTSNQLPIANAGADQTVGKGITVALDGSGSYDPDGDPLKYSWTFVSKPSGSMATLSNPDTKTPSFTPDLLGEYILQLIVNDFFTDSYPDTVTITVSNQLPVADAGLDQTVFLTGTSVLVSLDGSKSYDPDGDLLTYKWSLLEKPAGSGSILSPTDVVNPSLLIDIIGNYTAQLIVNDGMIDSSPDTVIVAALQPIDISIKAFRAPYRMSLGDTKDVTVVVKNLSSVDANFMVTVIDETEGTVIGTAAGVELAGNGMERVKTPYTPTTGGTHTLKATVVVINPLSGDPNMSDNTLTDTTLVVGGIIQ
jgi:hypothetical protein